MCRAIWALAIGPDEAACARLRRAAGADVQVVAMATTAAAAKETLGETEIDVAIVDARTADAYGIVARLRRQHPRVAVVWVGKDPPDTAHLSILDDRAEDELSSAVTRALIARKS